MENKTPQFTNLIQVTTHFADKEVCKKYLANMRWNGSPVCPHCNNKKVYIMKKNFKCASCRKQFSETKGTIFENSPIPLQKWFVAIWLLTSHKKGISSIQLGKDIGVTQKTAWFMNHRIRKAMESKSFAAPLNGEVEADETYIGGKNKNRHNSKKVKNSQGRSTKDKTAVIGLVERNGNVTAMKVDNVKAKTIKKFVEENVSDEATLYTDEFRGYNGIEKSVSKHLRVNHGADMYVIGRAHTNTIEGFWSLLKEVLLAFIIQYQKSI